MLVTLLFHKVSFLANSTYTPQIMSFVALITQDPNLLHVLSKPLSNDFHMHVVNPEKPVEAVCTGIQALDYAGALVLDENWQHKVTSFCSRSSLAATSNKAIDTLVVTQAGLLGDYVLGQAITELFLDHQWNIKGSSVVITGSGAMARALAKEIAGMGAETLNIVSQSRPAAEQALPQVANTRSVAHAFGELTAISAFERADLLIKTEKTSLIPKDVLGPHLSVVDLSPSPLSSLRQDAIRVGAPTFGLRDLQAHQLRIGMGAILGTKLDVSLFLDPLLSLAE